MQILYVEFLFILKVLKFDRHNKMNYVSNKENYLALLYLFIHVIEEILIVKYNTEPIINFYK